MMERLAKAQVNAKCRFHLDNDGWLTVWDGYAEAYFAPDEVAALKAFLAAAPPVQPPSPEGGRT